MTERQHMEKRLRGRAASPGIAWGPLYPWLQKKLVIPEHSLATDQITGEVALFQQALTTTGQQLAVIKDQVEGKLGATEGAIFAAYLLILQDPALVDEVEWQIGQGVNGAQAIVRVVEDLARQLAGLDDEYFRERAADVRDVGGRLLRNFLGLPQVDLAQLTEPVVIVASDLTPSETAQLPPGVALGFATVAGGPTSHLAIMARSLGIPAVVGLGQELFGDLPAGKVIIVDGYEGEIIIDPTPQTLAIYRQRQQAAGEQQRYLMGLRDLPAETKDGRPVELVANIGTPQDIDRVLVNGGQGVGLFRTEFLYLDRDTPPSEDEQFAAYKEVVAKMAPHPVTIRTLDVGGDKEIPYLGLPKEQNPFLGWRAIRYCLDNQRLFKTQLAAILRASAYGQVKIMLPMITTGEEISRAKEVVAEVKEDLDQRGILYDRGVPVGIMVETPAVALVVDRLAPEVDFFSIGTNDLVQYTLAVDRGNERVSHLYDPFHPAVLRLIQRVIAVGQESGRPVGMCGEMAGQVSATPLLVGLGLEEFSMDAGQIPLVKEVVRGLTYRKAQEQAKMVVGGW